MILSWITFLQKLIEITVLPLCWMRRRTVLIWCWFSSSGRKCMHLPTDTNIVPQIRFPNRWNEITFPKNEWSTIGAWNRSRDCSAHRTCKPRRSIFLFGNCIDYKMTETDTKRMRADLLSRPTPRISAMNICYPTWVLWLWIFENGTIEEVKSALKIRKSLMRSHSTDYFHVNRYGKDSSWSLNCCDMTLTVIMAR